MGKFFVLIFAIWGIALISSCKKENGNSIQNFEKFYEVPTSKAISTLDLLDMDVYVEWQMPGGVKKTFNSKVTQAYTTKEGVPVVVVVNGHFPGDKTIYFNDVNELCLSILFEKEKPNTSKKVFAFKPMFKNEGMTWNSRGDAEVGVSETFDEIMIASNGITSTNRDDLYLSMKVIIKKHKQ